MTDNSAPSPVMAAERRCALMGRRSSSRPLPRRRGYRSAGTHDELVAAGGRYARLWAAWTA
ncbi:hypothetical protein [Janibacter indicus]|uniref:hypothetical protein n=1 Tax=Janibacter indicus TaxID=857417 RepID=UPI00135665DD|nr:hypothetical protein [Janibacter indicus]